MRLACSVLVIVKLIILLFLKMCDGLSRDRLTLISLLALRWQAATCLHVVLTTVSSRNRNVVINISHLTHLTLSKQFN